MAEVKRKHKELFIMNELNENRGAGKIQIWCGDCLELMKNIPDGSIDAVITDPPY
jgi:DNA modification methylase